MQERFSNTILPEKKMIIQRYAGTVSLTDILAATHELWAHPEYDRSFNGISDFSGCTTRGSTADLRSLSQFLAENPTTSSGRWVLLSGDPLITAFGLLFVRLARQPAFHVCSTWDAACDYLQVEIAPQEI